MISVHYSSFHTQSIIVIIGGEFVRNTGWRNHCGTFSIHRFCCRRRFACFALASSSLGAFTGSGLGSSGRADRLDLSVDTAGKLSAQPWRKQLIQGRLHRTISPSGNLPGKPYSRYAIYPWRAGHCCEPYSLLPRHSKTTRPSSVQQRSPAYAWVKRNQVINRQRMV